MNTTNFQSFTLIRIWLKMRRNFNEETLQSLTRFLHADFWLIQHYSL